MCYSLISTGMFFNVLGMITWFYLCYKASMFCANKGYSFIVAQYKKFLTKD